MQAFRLILSSLASLLMVASVNAGVPRKTDYRASIDSLRALIQQEMRENALPGLSIALVDDQRVVWAAGFGYADLEKRTPATSDTVYRVGSISKLFTDVAIMQQTERGSLSLDAPITNYLPNFHPHNPFGVPITLRELMTHRAGLVREPPVGNYFDNTQPSVAAVVASLNETSLIFTPGSRTQYSNAGDTVAALALQKVTGQRYEAYIQSSILNPLSMDRSTFYPLRGGNDVAKGYMWNYAGQTFAAPTFQLGTGPAGNLTSSVVDLARFLVWMFGDLQGPGHVLKPETLQAMLAPQYPDANGGGAFGIGFAQINVHGDHMVGHRGGIYGFSSELLALPSQRLGVVVVTNVDNATETAWHIADRALRLMAAAKSGEHFANQLSSAVSQSEAHTLAGFYGAGETEFRLFERGGSLYMEPVGDGEIYKLQRYGNDLVTDGRTGWGFEVTPERGGITVNGSSETFLPKAAPPPVNPLPAAWRKLVGVYGPSFNPMTILDRYGRLTALLEMEYIPLTRVAGDAWVLSPQSAYAGETLRFVRGRNGNVVAARVGYVTLYRRD